MTPLHVRRVVTVPPRRLGGNARLLELLAVLLMVAPGAHAESLEVVPGSVVRWAGEGAERCERDGRGWPPLAGDCFYPIDLLEPEGTTELLRWKGGQAERRAVRIASYPYPVQRIQLPDDRMVNLAEDDLARALAEQERVAALWELEGDRRPSLPLLAPLESMPEGGRFGAKRVINGEPRNPHSGSDYTAPRGTRVRAADAGRVVLAEEHFFGGRSVFLDHGDGLISMYLHLDQIEVSVGDRVERGQTVGRVGSTGRATGPHLHFGVRWRGARVRPELLLGGVSALPSIDPGS